jgi:spore germination protein YaaH
MLYDLHWTGGSAGPVVEVSWAKRMLEGRIGEVGADHIIAAFPLYGYRWPSSGSGETVTYADAVRAVTSSGGSLRRDSATGSLQARLSSGGQVWVTDAIQLERLLEVAKEAGVRRVALWYIGQEDPAVWPLLRAR